MNRRLKKIKTILKHNYKKFKELSVIDLIPYYYDKKFYKGKLNKKQKKALLSLAIIKHEENQKEIQNWLRSGMLKLGCEWAIISKKGKRVTINEEEWYYDVNLKDVIDCMVELIQVGTAKGNKESHNKIDILREYCGGVINEFREI